MIQQYMTVDNKWDVLIWYGVGKRNETQVYEKLLSMGCPIHDAEYSSHVVANRVNTGLTFSNIDERVSFVCVSRTTNYSQLVNTVVHEMKHVQTHICSHYDVDESGEQAAYLIGYLTQKVYRLLSKLL